MANERIPNEEIGSMRERGEPIRPPEPLDVAIPGDGEPYSKARPDFARGQERDPDAIEHYVVDRFSRGMEDNPGRHLDVHEGDFAVGQSDRPRHPETRLHGRFARGQQLSDRGASSRS